MMIERHNMTEALFAASDLHQRVLQAARDALQADGCFRKEIIMKEVKDAFMIDAIRWDWIVRKLVTDKTMPGGAVELYPVAESFFKADRLTKQAMQADYPVDGDPSKYKDHPSFPGKYLAQGYGKRTAGWVLATFAGGRFALYKVRLAKKNADGRSEQNRKHGDIVTKKLISEGKTDKVADIAQTVGITVPPMITKPTP